MGLAGDGQWLNAHRYLTSDGRVLTGAGAVQAYHDDIRANQPEARQKKLMDDIRALRPELPTQNPFSGDGFEFSMDTRGLDAFRNEALRTGPSGWATLQEQLSDQRRSEALDRSTQQAGAFGASQRAGLASRGGLSGGAAERIGRSSAEQGMMLGQDAYRQAGQEKLDIGIQDENRRMATLSALPQMDMTLAQGQLGAKQWQAGQQDEWNKWLYGQQSATAAAD